MAQTDITTVPGRGPGAGLGAARLGRAAVLAGFCAAIASPVAAHPHVFVDTGFELIFDGAGRLAALRVVWVYDELYSLLLVEEGGYDLDGDGALSAEELEPLRGFDMAWQDGFEGDTYVTQGGAAQPLGGPESWTTEYRDGRMISTHLRRLETPLMPAGAPVLIQPYDPGYYTGYTITGATTLTGRDDCTTEIFEPDLEAANAELKAALAEYSADVSLEDVGYPEVGGVFSEELRLTCAPR